MTLSASFVHSSLTRSADILSAAHNSPIVSLTQQVKIFLSSRIGGCGGHFFAPGRQHYSYEIARGKFETALRYLDLAIHDIPRPEIYAAPVSRQFLSGNCCHLIFKPAEWIRLLKGVRNIACVAWEFDKLTAPATAGPRHPFTDMRRMLTLPDEVWTPCEFTRRVFKANGIPNVHRVPAPISVPSAPASIRFPDIPPELDKIPWIKLRIGFGRYSDINRSVPNQSSRISDIILDGCGDHPPQIILAILNPHDLRKNLSALIGGFLEFHSEHPDWLLLLKLVVDNTNDRLENVLAGIMSTRISGYELIDSEGIWLTTAFVPEPLLADLYRLSCAYLCTSLAEGQNLPLQEAMAWGLVPITPRHTAMLDYITGDNAVIIHSQGQPIDRPDTATGTHPDASWHVSTSADVSHALRSFARLDALRRRELGERARATIARNFSIEAVAELIHARLILQS
jgi:glycosyltransferase involved in cell wall biosynthesis